MRSRHVFVLLLLAAGCDPAPATREAPAPAASMVAPAKTETKTAPAAKPVVVARLDGTPHDEEHALITLKWKGNSADVPIYGAAGDTKSSGMVKFTKGAVVDFKQSVVLVIKPNMLVAGKGAKLFGASIHNLQTGATAEGPGDDIEVPSGEQVAVLKYAGEGTCYVQYVGKTYLCGCPSDEQFEGDTNAAAETEWWVQPTEGPGWLKVDDRIDVAVGSQLD